RTVTTLGRTISKARPGMERQPSSKLQSPLLATISGLTRTSGPSPTSYVKIRRWTPTCGAASPTPDASYIVSYIVSTSRASAPSISSTSRERCFSTGSPNFRMVYVATSSGYQRPRACPSDAQRVDVYAQTAVTATVRGRDGERVAQRGDVVGAHERACARARRRRAEHGHVRVREACDGGVDRFAGAGDLGERTEGREPEELPPFAFDARDQLGIPCSDGAYHLVVGDPRLHQQPAVRPDRTRAPGEEPQRLLR